MVILGRDEAKDARIFALDPAKGTPRWDKKRQSLISFSTPVVWDTPAGKQVVAPGFGRMVGYDLKTGAERGSVAGMPSGCCASPVVAGGSRFFAAGSPGGGEDKERKMPRLDLLLRQAGAQ